VENDRARGGEAHQRCCAPSGLRHQGCAIRATLMARSSVSLAAARPR